uniref:Uncharacterized protein n=1 Tax=Salix viminalis TaxID=40686 RepID=A0A6N2N3T0_SALVM
MKGAKKMESKDERLKAQVAIRCAKAAILLSKLKSFPNRHLTTSIDDQGEEKEMLIKTMVREIGDLKMELVRERLKNKRIKTIGLMEVILQVVTVLSISTFLLYEHNGVKPAQWYETYLPTIVENGKAAISWWPTIDL